MKEHFLNICRMCADRLLGFTLTKISSSKEPVKCDFCRKKTYCDYYKVTPIKEEE